MALAAKTIETQLFFFWQVPRTKGCKFTIYIKPLSAIAIHKVNTLNSVAIVAKTIETQLVFFLQVPSTKSCESSSYFAQ